MVFPTIHFKMDEMAARNTSGKESKLCPNVAPFVPRQKTHDYNLTNPCDSPNYDNVPVNFQSTSFLAAYPSDGQFYQDCYVQWHPWASYAPIMPPPAFSVPKQAMVIANKHTNPSNLEETLRTKPRTTTSVSYNNTTQQARVQKTERKGLSAKEVAEKVGRKSRNRKCESTTSNEEVEEYSSTKDEITPWPVNHSKNTKNSVSLDAKKYTKSKSCKNSEMEECSSSSREYQEKNVNILGNEKQFEWREVHRKKERALPTRRNENSLQNNNHFTESTVVETSHLKKTQTDAIPENYVSSDTHEPAFKMTQCGVPTATGERLKKKKKSDGQRKKEYRNKIMSLPSVQGKVLTVTHEFYNLLTRNETESLSSNTQTEKSGEIKFKSGDFPALGRDSDTLLDSFSRNCSLQESERNFDLQSDSDWSDIDMSEQPFSKSDPTQYRAILKWPAKGVMPANKENRVPIEDFPMLGETVKSSKKKFSYSESVKKGSSSQLKNDEGAVSASSTKLLSTMKAKPQLKLKNMISSQSDQGILDGEPSKKPKANSLIHYNLITMLNKKKSAAKEVNKKNLISNENKKMCKVKPVIANILDSSAPSRRRGKEREKPARKKPTAMKKIILKEREERKLMNKLSAIKLTENVQLETPMENESVNDKLEDNLKTTRAKTDKTLQGVIHSRKFREYCNQMLNPEMDDTVTKLIQDLTRFQDRLFQKDPIKAKMRRRLVVGLREVTKHLKLKKLKCVILAPNLEKIKSNGGLDEAMNTIISLAKEQNIPFVFALGRRGLGRVCLKKVPVSCVGIFNYEGSETNFKHLCELAAVAQNAYNQAVEPKNGVNTSVIETANSNVPLVVEKYI